MCLKIAAAFSGKNSFFVSPSQRLMAAWHFSIILMNTEPLIWINLLTSGIACLLAEANLQNFKSELDNTAGAKNRAGDSMSDEMEKSVNIDFAFDEISLIETILICVLQTCWLALGRTLPQAQILFLCYCEICQQKIFKLVWTLSDIGFGAKATYYTVCRLNRGLWSYSTWKDHLSLQRTNPICIDNLTIATSEHRERATRGLDIYWRVNRRLS